MKRIWFAVIFLALSVGICATEQIYLESTYKAICSYVDNEDEKAIIDYWNSRNDILYAFSDHRTLDSLSEAVNELEDGEDKKIALNKIRAISKAYYENQRITFSNIF